MADYKGALRIARNEVSHEIPQLAAQLNNDPRIVRSAIANSIEKQDVDPAAISDEDYIRAEKYAFLAHTIGVQQEHVTKGKDANAQFKVFGATALNYVLPKSPDGFRRHIAKTLHTGARHVRRTYSNGPTPETSWWTAANAHYAELVRKDQENVRVRAGNNLFSAIRDAALGHSILQLAVLTNKHLPDASPQARQQAAHDLAYLSTTKASMHLVELAFNNNIGALAGAIRSPQDASGSYSYERGTRENWQSVYGREKTRTTTLKCPAHVMAPGMAETPLQTYVHAAINLGGQYNIFSLER